MVRRITAEMSSIRTDPELEVHSIDVDKLLSKHIVQNKFSLNDVPRGSILKITKDANSSTDVNDGSLIDVTNGSKNRCNEYGYDVTDSEDCGDSKIDLGYHFTWSDEEEPSYLDQQGFGLNVYESIRAISKEATKKIDAVLAVDHVDQLQEEMKKLRSEIKCRSADYSELKGIVQMKDHQIGTLELERDLYKADTTKLANDLETCLLKLRGVGGTSSPISVGYRDSVKETSNELEANREAPHPSNPPESTKPKSDGNDPFRSSPIIPSNSCVDPQSCSDSPNETVQTVSTFTSCTGTASITSNRSSAETPFVTPPRPYNIIPVIEKARQVPFSCTEFVSHDKLNQYMSNDGVIRQQQRRKKMLSFALCRGNSKNKVKTFIPVQPIPIRNSTSGLHLQTQRNNVAVTSDGVDDSPGQFQRPHGILQGQIKDMGQRLHSSITTSEDLRRRIAMLHLYHDQHVNQLDNRLVDACVDRTKMQFDFSGQQSRLDRQHKAVVMDLESKVCQQEHEIQSLRKPRVVTFNL